MILLSGNHLIFIAGWEELFDLELTTEAKPVPFWNGSPEADWSYWDAA